MDIRIADIEDMQNVFALRTEVFVREQNVPREIELDTEDEHATHIIAIQNNMLVGCGRMIFSENDAHLGRLAVKKEYRNLGIGAAICQFMVDYCIEKGCNRIWLNSQLHAKRFYEKLGFMSIGDVFIEAGIEHIQMRYR